LFNVDVSAWPMLASAWRWSILIRCHRPAVSADPTNLEHSNFELFLADKYVPRALPQQLLPPTSTMAHFVAFQYYAATLSVSQGKVVRAVAKPRAMQLWQSFDFAW
jgi:hypothetical protein